MDNYGKFPGPSAPHGSSGTTILQESIVLSEATIGEDVAIIDIFRVAGGRIVEMWDVMEPIPAPGVAKNSGKF